MACELENSLGNETIHLEGFVIYNNDDIYGCRWRNWKMHPVELEKENRG